MIARNNRAVTRMIVAERARQILPIGLVIAALVGVFVLRSIDFSREASRHQGVVETSNWKDSAAIQRVFVTVRLDDGREVQAAGHFAAAPRRGDVVEVSDRVSPFGGESFVVVGEAPTHG